MNMTMLSKAQKRKSELTSRQKSIIEILAKNTSSESLTASLISEKLSVSTRTVLRELPDIEKWLLKHQFAFSKKPGVGLTLNETLEGQQRILDLLSSETISKEYSKEERRRLILSELLCARHPLKSFNFTSRFQISDGTLSADLDYVAHWLSKYSISLVRKQGVGAYIEGGEGNFRKAVVNAVYESMREDELLAMLQEQRAPEGDVLKLEVQARNRILQFIDGQILKSVEKVLIDAEKAFSVKYADSAYMALIVHISLAVKRLQNNEEILLDESRLEKMRCAPEFTIAEQIGKRLEETFGITIPESEIGFITMHLMVSNIWSRDSEHVGNLKREQLCQIVSKMINLVSAELFLPLGDSDNLFEDLCNHIEPLLSRLAIGVNIQNKQMHEIKENYPKVYAATEKACQLLKAEAAASAISQSEIAFIAMHFCAAAEKMRGQQGKIAVAVVCPTGIGTSRILAAGLMKNFNNIEIYGTLSAMQLKERHLRSQQVDLIISTVALNIDFPNVCVSPILSEQDKALLQKTFKSIPISKKIKTESKRVSPSPFEQIIHMTKLGQCIIDIVDNVAFYRMERAVNKDQIIDAACKIFVSDTSSRQLIKEQLTRREKLGTTFVKDIDMLLFHCKTSAVTECRFGYIRLLTPLLCDDLIVKGAIVMLIPQEENQLHLDVMSNISFSLIEDKELSDAVSTKEAVYTAKVLEKCLGKYYKSNIIKNWE